MTRFVEREATFAEEGVTPADDGSRFAAGGPGFADVAKVCRALRDMPCGWYVCGGWAIDLFLGRVTRAHKDVDISVARADQLRAQEFMRARGWTLGDTEAHKGAPRSWKPRPTTGRKT